MLPPHVWRRLPWLAAAWLFSVSGAAAQGLPVDTGSHIPVYLWFVGAGILALAIIYGIMRNRSRTQTEKNITDSATRELYRSEDRKN
jgi:hypothetical protein